MKIVIFAEPKTLPGAGGGGGGGGAPMGGGGGGTLGLITEELLRFIIAGVDRPTLASSGRLPVWTRWVNFCLSPRSLESYKAHSSKPSQSKNMDTQQEIFNVHTWEDRFWICRLSSLIFILSSVCAAVSWSSLAFILVTVSANSSCT